MRSRRYIGARDHDHAAQRRLRSPRIDTFFRDAKVSDNSVNDHRSQHYVAKFSIGLRDQQFIEMRSPTTAMCEALPTEIVKRRYAYGPGEPSRDTRTLTYQRDRFTPATPRLPTGECRTCAAPHYETGAQHLARLDTARLISSSTMRRSAESNRQTPVPVPSTIITANATSQPSAASLDRGRTMNALPCSPRFVNIHTMPESDTQTPFTSPPRQRITTYILDSQNIQHQGSFPFASESHVVD